MDEKKLEESCEECSLKSSSCGGYESSLCPLYNSLKRFERVVDKSDEKNRRGY